MGNRLSQEVRLSPNRRMDVPGEAGRRCSHETPPPGFTEPLHHPMEKEGIVYPILWTRKPRPKEVKEDT